MKKIPSFRNITESCPFVGLLHHSTARAYGFSYPMPGPLRVHDEFLWLWYIRESFVQLKTFQWEVKCFFSWGEKKKKKSCQFLLSGFIIRITVETQNYQLWTQLELLLSAVYRMERESLSQIAYNWCARQETLKWFSRKIPDHYHW